MALPLILNQTTVNCCPYPNKPSMPIITYTRTMGISRCIRSIVLLVTLVTAGQQEHSYAQQLMPPARIDPAPFADNANHWYAIFNKENIINPLPDHPRYDPADLKDIADNIVLFQKANGGWPKNYDVFAILTAAQKENILSAKRETN